jgi:4-hydroxythreonine-4-phosphate dehydrogenase
MIVVSIGCPAGIGPEVSVAAAARRRRTPCVLVGDRTTILEAAKLAGISERRFADWQGRADNVRTIYVLHAGPELGARDRRPGKPTRATGAAQLAYIDAGYDLARAAPGRALVTGPVSKAAIARSGAPGAERFLGHTEWLRDRDGAKTSVMCFAAEKLVTSLVTTHVPLAKVATRLTPEGVAQATQALFELLSRIGKKRPHLAVCSLNPHAGESELLGDEETRAIVPGIAAARRKLGRRAVVLGPIGAETAYRKAYAGDYAGVVAMYHDQATIPMKLVAFGDAVNVTMGLSVVRTSVDHGTAYDIAWQGRASADGMAAAIALAERMLHES